MTNEIPPINFCIVCGQRMDEREAFGRARPFCPACGYVHFEDPKVAVGVLAERDGQVLLVRRVNVPGQGKWTLPAGFVDADEDPRTAAERECREETGLEIRIGELLDVLHAREHPRGASIFIVFRGHISGGEMNASDDVDQVSFFGPDELPPLAFSTTKQILERWRSGS